jgi:hypothetical protein
LENPWIAAPPNFVIEKSLSYQGRRKWPPSFSKLFPNISLAVLSDFKGLERKNVQRVYRQGKRGSIFPVRPIIAEAEEKENGFIVLFFITY